jgi:hypothetical protein
LTGWRSRTSCSATLCDVATERRGTGGTAPQTAASGPRAHAHRGRRVLRHARPGPRTTRGSVTLPTIRRSPPSPSPNCIKVLPSPRTPLPGLRARRSSARLWPTSTPCPTGEAAARYDPGSAGHCRWPRSCRMDLIIASAKDLPLYTRNAQDFTGLDGVMDARARSSHRRPRRPPSPEVTETEHRTCPAPVSFRDSARFLDHLAPFPESTGVRRY